MFLYRKTHMVNKIQCSAGCTWWAPADFKTIIIVDSSWMDYKLHFRALNSLNSHKYQEIERRARFLHTFVESVYSFTISITSKPSNEMKSLRKSSVKLKLQLSYLQTLLRSDEVRIVAEQILLPHIGQYIGPFLIPYKLRIAFNIKKLTLQV